MEVGNCSQIWIREMATVKRFVRDRLSLKAAYSGHEKAKEIIKGLQDEGKIVF